MNQLLPLHREVNQSVLLACDDEAVRAAAAEVGLDRVGAGERLAADVKAALDIGQISGLRHARIAGVYFTEATRPRPVPSFLALLCVCVVAASRMAPSESHSTGAYYVHLRDLFRFGGRGALPEMDVVTRLFELLGEWLTIDLGGARGRLLLPEAPYPPFVGLFVSQTVFRKRDREILSEFFAERMSADGDGFDPLRRLQRWPGRHGLTRHALALLDDPEMAERVRAAIRSARTSWDGSVISAEAGGRLWPARLRLLPHPPRLRAGAGNRELVAFQVDGSWHKLEPGGEVALPWTLVERARGRPLLLGDADASAGALRLPALGDTILFELADDGLVRIERPSADKLWLATRDPEFVGRLERFRVETAQALPTPWILCRDVPIAELGLERAPALGARAAFALTGGLSLESRVYLAGGGPQLEAGELDELVERLPVAVNGVEIGKVGSGERLGLPGEPGVCEVVVGEGEWRVRYHVEERGEPTGVGALGYGLGGERALRTGAGALHGVEGLAVCGAILSDPWAHDLPFLTRAGRLVAIGLDGVATEYERPDAPAWLQLVGFDRAGRWELVSDRLAWILHASPTTQARGWARQMRPLALERLDEDAARAVLALRETPVVQMASDTHWRALRTLALATLDLPVPTASEERTP